MSLRGPLAVLVAPLLACAVLAASSGCKEKSGKREPTPRKTPDDRTAAAERAGPLSYRLLHHLVGHELGVESLAISQDGRFLASGSYDKTVRLWDLDTGKVKRTFTGHEDWVPTVAFHPKDALVASGSGDKRILVNRYNRSTKPIEIKEHNGVHALAFDPEGEHLAAAGFGGGLRLWHLRSGDWRREFKGHGSDVYAVAFSPKGKLLASGSADQTIRLWDLASAKTLRTLVGHKDWVLSLSFNRDGKILRSVGRDGMLRTWDVATGKPLVTHVVTGDAIHAADFSLDGRFIALSSGRQVKLLDAGNGRELRRFPEQPKGVTAVVFSSDMRMLAFGGNDGSIHVFTTGAQ